MTQMLTEQANQPAVRAWSRLLRAYATTTRLLSAELQAEHGLTINDYEALLVLSRAELAADAVRHHASPRGPRGRRPRRAGQLRHRPSRHLRAADRRRPGEARS